MRIWHTTRHSIAITLAVVCMMFLWSSPAFAQTVPPTTSSPPSVAFIAGIVGVFVAILVGFLVFARSQGCDTNKDKKHQWE